MNLKKKVLTKRCAKDGRDLNDKGIVTMFLKINK